MPDFNRVFQSRPKPQFAGETARLGGSVDVGELYERFAPQLKFFLAKQSRLKDKAEDLLADTFVSVLRYPPTEQLLRADNYLWRIAWRVVNTANRHAKQNTMRMTDLHKEAPNWLLGCSGTLSPIDAAEWLDYREQVRRGLEDLTPQERQSVLLVRLGYSYNEIATRMGISIESLRKYLREGYLKLKAFRPSEED